MEYRMLSVAISLLICLWCGPEVVSARNSADCPDIYRRFSTSHSYCQPKNQTCGIITSGLTQEEKNQIITLHNKYRRIIATQGEENNGLPAAANMLLMEWDNELAMVAQKYSDQCIYAHDRPNQRRVRNFGVGQNIAIQRLTGVNVQAPVPDWDFAVSDWYEEIVYFSKDMICDFPQPNPAQGEYRHFSQVIWARSFRVGCGYTMYKQGNTYSRLYICNYGPSGNVYGSCVYKEGSACSKCPQNTQCTSGSEDPGLCKRINGNAPFFPVSVPHNFGCNFMDPSKKDCRISTMGVDHWYIIRALGGNYLETVLQPGQNGTIIFSKPFVGGPNVKAMCAQVRYRKGPNLAKDAQNNDAKETFVIPTMNNYTFSQSLPSYQGESRQQMSTYNLTLQWNNTSTLKLSFAVPSNAQPQFFNVGSILGVEGSCQN